MSNDFVSWLIELMNAQGWTNSELARRADVVHSTVSLVISGKSKPGPDLCQGIARAFHIPAEEVFRRAGLLPAIPADDQTLYEINTYAKNLPVAVREQVLDYIKYLYEKSQ